MNTNNTQDEAKTANTTAKPTRARASASTTTAAAKKNTPPAKENQAQETVPVFTSRRVWPD